MRFVIQPGIAPWEERESIADSRWNTISVFARELTDLTPLARMLIELRPEFLRSVFRLHIALMPEGIGVGQRRRLAAQLESDPPGFRDTRVKVFGARFCAMSALKDASLVDLAHLTSYRRSALIEIDAGEEATAELCDRAGQTLSEIGGAGVGWLLDRQEQVAVVRLLDFESHATLQLFGSIAASETTLSILRDTGVHSIPDIARLHIEIAQLSGPR